MRRTSRTLAALVLALLSIGIVMLASTSSVRASESYHDPYYFLKRQLVWLALSLVTGVLLARFDYHLWQKLAAPLGIVAVLLLVLVLVPHVGTVVGGSRRWLRVGRLGMQPSEPAKFASVVVMAAWMTAIGHRARRIKEGLLLPLFGLGAVLVLLLLEPDFGTTVLIAAVGMLVMFAGGTRIGGLLVTGALGAVAFGFAVLKDPVRRGRVFAFVDPENHPKTAYHLAQSKISFIKGGLFGVGLGNSLQKQFYLPEAHTDFILAIIGEELGFAATCFVLLLFVGIVICGLLISLSAVDRFGGLLAFGLTMLLGVQAAINIGVVTGCLPTKGLALPFISYGGSSLVISVAAIGVLLNIAGHCGQEQADEHTRLIRDRAHDF